MHQQTELKPTKVTLETVLDYIDHLYLDTQGVGTTTLGESAFEDYIIKLISRFLISLCTSWYAAVEIIDYIKKKKLIKDLTLSNS